MLALKSFLTLVLCFFFLFSFLMPKKAHGNCASVTCLLSFCSLQQLSSYWYDKAQTR